MDAVKFLKEWKRLCNQHKGGDNPCNTCKLTKNITTEIIYCMEILQNYHTEAVEIVEQWSKENPAKTYKDDFLEKFPNVFRKENGMPLVGWCDIHNGGNCLYVFEEDRNCDDCWDMEIEE